MAGAIALAICSPASAQDAAPTGGAEATNVDNEEARALFDRGSQAFEVGRYGAAAEHFQQAYELSNQPALLFNIYSALEREGRRLGDAADALEQYLERSDLPAERHATLSARLASIRARIAEQDADETRRQAAEQERERAREAELAAEREAERDASGDLAESGGGVHPAATGLLITSGALLASFAVFAILSGSEDSSLAESCGRDVPGVTCTEDDVGTLRTYNTLADISWITAAAAGATGLVLLFVLDKDADESEARLSPWATPGGAGATVGGSF